MKRIATLFLVAVILLIECSSALAVQMEGPENGGDFYPGDNEIEVFELDENTGGLSNSELAESRLLLNGHSYEFIQSIDDDNLDIIASADSVMQVVSYFVEMHDSLTDTVELTQVSPSDFYELGEDDLEDIPENFADRVMPQGGEIRSGGGNEVINPIINASVNGGKLVMLTSFYYVNNSQYASHYLVVSEFAWTKMPNYRGTDFFGLSRDSSTNILPNTFNNYYSYKRYRYFYMATNHGVTRSLNSVNQITYRNRPNDDSSWNALAIRYSVPADVNPPVSMFVGQSFLSSNYIGLRGGVCYQGTLKYPSIKPQYFNHIATYLHQKGLIFAGSVSVNYPLGLSFYVSNFAPKYSNPMVQILHTTWS